NAHGDWKALAYCHEKVEQRWRHGLCDLLLSEYESLTIDDADAHCRDFDEFRRFINAQRQRFWHVHFAKKTQHPKATINYLGRYLKRPPIAGAKLAHYRGEANLSFRYLDHHTGKYETEEVSQLELIKRLVQHIPEKHFRMIRYFGFLANRVVGNQLSKVREALGMESHPPRTPALRYGQMIKSFLKVDPFECILCGGRMRFAAFHAGVGRKNIINEALSRRGEGLA
ncbi:transposase, partial [Vibrio sp. 10N.261.45.E2]